MTSPLRGREGGDIDFVVVRENTEGEYSSIGGKIFPGTDREVVIQETVMTRTGVDRILRFAFNLAQRRQKKHLTSATKSNGISITMPYWDERVVEMAKAFPDVAWDKFHIDILTAHFVLNPDRFDVVVASNLFGDILSDLGPACAGTIGIAPKATIIGVKALHNGSGSFGAVIAALLYASTPLSEGGAEMVAVEGPANIPGDDGRQGEAERVKPALPGAGA